MGRASDIYVQKGSSEASFYIMNIPWKQKGNYLMNKRKYSERIVRFWLFVLISIVIYILFMNKLFLKEGTSTGL